MSKKVIYYAYYLVDKNCSGVTSDWNDCKSMIQSHNHVIKKFESHKEALEYLLTVIEKSPADKAFFLNNSPFKETDIFFDSGTGRGLGVESSVTNYLGESLLKTLISFKYVTPFGTYLIPSIKNPTNNYGELLAFYFALKIALSREDIKSICIFGDSQLVIQYWSLNHSNKKNLHSHTVILIEIVSQLRIKFEKKGGRVSYISGSKNPSDLGFHKS